MAARKKGKGQKAKGSDNWNVDRGVRTEIQGLITLALSALLFLALYHPAPGFIGEALRLLMTTALGRAAWVLPVLVTVTGLAWVMNVAADRLLPRVGGLALGGLVAAVFYQVARSSQPPFTLDLVRDGGGYVGAGLAWALTAAFGPVGRSVILFSGALVAALLLVNVPGMRIGAATLETAKGLLARVTGGVGDSRRGESQAATTGVSRKRGGRDASDATREVAIRTYPGDTTRGEEEPGRDDEASRPSTTAKTNGDKAGRTGTAKPAPSAGTATKSEDTLPVGAEARETPSSTKYRLPPATLISRGSGGRELGDNTRSELNRKARLLESTLKDFGIRARVLEISHGPTVTRFDIHPGPGVKVSQIVSLADDIALSMATTGVRVVAPVPGKSAVGIEVPNSEVASVTLREIVESREFLEHESLLSVALGADITGRPLVVSLEDLLHVLIAGATGSGKSISIRCVIASILMRARPDQVKLLLIDPKVVEFMTYDGLPHLLAPVVTDAKKAAGCLTWAVKEMERRYRHFAERGVRDLPAYNRRARDRGEPTIPRIVIIIDELADLMMVARVDVEDAIQRLAQMARAAGIHLVVATQRPSVDVITGVIKANIPSRVAFAVSSSADSRTILDAGGAEKLLGHGDMLFSPVGRDRAIRAQGSFLSDDDLERLLDYARQQEDPEYRSEVIEAAEAADSEGGSADSGDASDPKLDEAVEVVLEAGEASVSMLQRRLRVGYTRAGRLMDTMENMGVVGPYQGSKPREVLLTRSQYRAERDDTKDAAAGEEEES